MKRRNKMKNFFAKHPILLALLIYTPFGLFFSVLSALIVSS